MTYATSELPMGKRNVPTNPTLIEAEPSEMMAAKKRRMLGSGESAALTLLSLKRETRGKCLLGPNSLCSSVTDDEEDISVCRTHSAELKLMALKQPRLLLRRKTAPFMQAVRPLPKGRPLPAAPRLPTGVVRAEKKKALETLLKK